MSTGLIFHADLDGLYSAKLILNSDYKIDEAYAVDYGRDYSDIVKNQKEFISVDFAENIAGEKTILFVDHHIRNENRSSGAKKEVIEKSESCVKLLITKRLVSQNLISEEDCKYINIVDSASFIESKVNPIDIIFPDINSKLGKYILLNDLLRKNRKSNLQLYLLDQETMDINTLLYKTEKFSDSILKYEKYSQFKMQFYEKLEKNKEKFVKEFGEIPALFTKNFSQFDWKGYDKNIFNYLYKDKPFTMLVFEMNDKINVQIQKNPFCEEALKMKSLYESVKNIIKEPRGHENILMISFENIKDAINNLDNIISVISENM